MFGNIRLFKWSTGSAKATSAPAHAWILDRNWDRAEGERLLKAKNYAGAQEHLAKAIAEAEARGHSIAKRTHLRLLLAEAQRQEAKVEGGEPDAAKLAVAEQTARYAIQAAAKGSDRSLYIQCLDTLADIFGDEQKFDAVEKAVQESIRFEAEQERPDPIRMARRVFRLGVARHRMGRTQDAIPVLEKAVKLHETAFGADHSETGHQLTELGAAYRADGRHVEAQDALRRAMQIHRKAGGYDSKDAIQALHHLAGSLEDCGNLDGAAEQYETALTYKQRLIGSNMEDLAELQFGLANLHLEWSHLSRSRELLMEAASVFARKGGVRLAVTYETLAHVEECSGRYGDAVKQLTLAGKVWEGMRPERTPELIHNMERRIELLVALRRKGEADYLGEKLGTVRQQLDAEIAAGLEKVEPELVEFSPEEEMTPPRRSSGLRVSLPATN